MKYSVQAYSTGRSHRLAFIPEVPVALVRCRVYPPGGGEVKCHDFIKLEDSLFVTEFQFRQLGDYFFVLEADGAVTNVLKAVVEK